MRRCFRTLVALMLFMPAVASAGGTATIAEQGGSRINLAWQGSDALRLGKQGASRHLIINHGHAQIVMSVGGHQLVIGANSMIPMLRGKLLAHGNPLDGFKSIRKTGKTENVAGIQGRVYRVVTVKNNGRKKITSVVLTSDPRVVQMTEVYVHAAQKLFHLNGVDELMKKMPRHDRGILRVGDRFRLQSITGHMPPDSMFRVPGGPLGLLGS